MGYLDISDRMFLRHQEHSSTPQDVAAETFTRLLAESDDDYTEPPLYQSIIGIILMIIGAVCTNLGNNLMSLGHSQQREIDVYNATQELKKQKSGVSVDSLDSKDQIELTTREKDQGREKRQDSLDAPLDLSEKVKTRPPLVEQPSDLTTSTLMGESEKRERSNSLGLILDRDREPLPSMSRIIHPCLPGKNLPTQLDKLVERGEEFLGRAVTKTSILGRVEHKSRTIEEGCENADAENCRKSDTEEICRSFEEDCTAPPEKTWWLVGTCVFGFGALVVFLSFGFAAQSLLAALESVQFVSNVFFAKYIHKEEITRRIVISTTVIVVGNVFVVAFANHSSHRLTAAHIADSYIHNLAFHVWTGVSSVVFLVCYFTWRKFSKARLERNETYHNHNYIETSCFIAYMALIGSQAVLHSKNLSMLMQHCIQGENQFASNFRSIIWIEIVLWVSTAYLYCGLINTGLNLYPPAFFIPVQAVFFALFTIICGGIFFYEFQFNVLQSIMFSLGCFLIFSGVWALAPDQIDLEGYSIPNTARILAVNTDEILNETSNEILGNRDRDRNDNLGGGDLTPRIGMGYGTGLILTPRTEAASTAAAGGNAEKYITTDSAATPTIPSINSIPATPSNVPLEFDVSPAGSKYNLKEFDSTANLLNRPGTQGTIQTWVSDDRSDAIGGRGALHTSLDNTATATGTAVESYNSNEGHKVDAGGMNPLTIETN